MVLLGSARWVLRSLVPIGLLLGASTASGVPVEIGLNFTAARGSGPPDTMGAVGEEHIVHFINDQFKVFRKADATLVVDQSSQDFWGTAGLFPSDNFDPRVVYDPFARRWYAVEAAERSSPESALNGVTAFGELILLRAGESVYEEVFDGRNRWGDYSATVVDPEDPRVFWTFQEWAETESRWGTQIAQLILLPEPSTALLLAGGLAGLAIRRREPG